IEQYHVYPDPRARFADPTNPDRPPMPPDDPAAWAAGPHPQKPCSKGQGTFVEGAGYLDLMAAWSEENRAAAKAEGDEPKAPPTLSAPAGEGDPTKQSSGPAPKPSPQSPKSYLLTP